MTIKELSCGKYKVEVDLQQGDYFFRLYPLLSFDFKDYPVVDLDEYKPITNEYTMFSLDDSMYVFDCVRVVNDVIVERYDPTVWMVLCKYETCKRSILYQILCAGKRDQRDNCNKYDMLRNEWHIKLSEIKLVYNDLIEYVDRYVGNSILGDEHQKQGDIMLPEKTKMMVLHRYTQLDKMCSMCGECKRCKREREKLG
jgi:hypothetical protein